MNLLDQTVLYDEDSDPAAIRRQDQYSDRNMYT